MGNWIEVLGRKSKVTSDIGELSKATKTLIQSKKNESQQDKTLKRYNCHPEREELGARSAIHIHTDPLSPTATIIAPPAPILDAIIRSSEPMLPSRRRSSHSFGNIGQDATLINFPSSSRTSSPER